MSAGHVITVDPIARNAAGAAAILELLVPGTTWRYSWLVPHPAVWTLDGEPMPPSPVAS